MSQCTLAQLDASSRVCKRAQYEAFEFEVGDGGVLVRNNSHEVPSEHEYVVTITDGVPSSCECPADERFDGACKHRVAVAIREPVLDAAVAEQVAADGGTVEPAAGHADVPDQDAESQTEESTENEAEACSECAGLSGDFPCWECVRTGRREIPE